MAQEYITTESGLLIPLREIPEPVREVIRRTVKSHTKQARKRGITIVDGGETIMRGILENRWRYGEFPAVFRTLNNPPQFISVTGD